MADDCKENENGNDIQPNMSLSLVVSIPVCHTGEWGTIPRKRELNTSCHKTTDSAFGLHIFGKIKTGQKTERKSKWKRTPYQHLC